MKKEIYKLDARAGNNFEDVAKKAKQIAKEKGVTVEFYFNGVMCLVNGNTNIKWLYRDYANSWTMEWKTVGADCVKSYSIEIQTELKKRIKINEEKRAAEYAEYRAKQENGVSEDKKGTVNPALLTISKSVNI